MSLALLLHYLLLNMFRMLIHLSSGACVLFVELFHGLYCSGTMCVGVTLWFGWGGVVSVCRLKPAYIKLVSLYSSLLNNYMQCFISRVDNFQKVPHIHQHKIPNENALK